MKRPRLAPVLCAALAVLALLGCHHTSPPAEEASPEISGSTIAYRSDAPQLSSLATAPARRQAFAVSHLTGRLYWDDDTTVRVFSPVSGRVCAVRADLGETVAANATLAVIDSPDFGQARADARSAVAALAVAEENLARERDLFAHGAAAQKDVEAADAAEQAALAERDRSVAKLRLWGGTVSGSDELYNLISPLAGIVVARNLTPGQEVRSDLMLANANNLVLPLFVVSDPGRLWLSVDVPQDALGTLRRGEKLVVSTPAFPGQTFAGTVADVGLSLDPSTRTAQVRGVVDNPNRTLKAEMYVDVDVVAAVGGREPPLEVPGKAIFTIQGKSYLFIETATGRFDRRQVGAGVEQDGMVPVYSGLSVGDNVVVEGGLLLESVLEPAD